MRHKLHTRAIVKSTIFKSKITLRPRLAKTYEVETVKIEAKNHQISFEALFMIVPTISLFSMFLFLSTFEQAKREDNLNINLTNIKAETSPGQYKNVCPAYSY